MDKAINFLEDLTTDLIQLSGLCNVLSCVGESKSIPPIQDVMLSYRTLCDALDREVEKIDKVVSDYYKTRAGKPVAKP